MFAPLPAAERLDRAVALRLRLPVLRDFPNGDVLIEVRLPGEAEPTRIRLPWIQLLEKVKP